MDIYEQIVKLREEGRRGAVATIVNVRGSIPSFKTAKMLVRDDGSILGTIGGGCVEAEVWQAVQTQARYIGMIGSKRKTIAIFRELTKEGIPAHLFERVHAPVGLDIGAVTPEEIAVAITAELIAIRRHAERALPHMSWFHSRKIESDDTESAGEALEDTELNS